MQDNNKIQMTFFLFYTASPLFLTLESSVWSASREAWSMKFSVDTVRQGELDLAVL